MDPLGRFADRLDEQGYAHHCLLVNPSAPFSPWPNFDVTRNRLLLSPNATRDLLLFLYLGIPLALPRLRAYFADADLGDLQSTGFIERHDGEIEPLRVVIPFLGRYFATDIPGFFPTARAAQPVYMGFDSFLLASLLPAGSGRALDLCCGTGIHAVLLAARGYAVTASDVDARAVELSRVNAAINRVSGSTRFRQGNLFDAVDGVFDLVVTKPPCQAIPDAIDYPIAGRGGPDGLRIARRILAEANGYLVPGGRLLTVLQLIGDDRTVPFAAELAGLATAHSWRVRLFLTKRIPAERQVDLLAPYAGQITPDDRAAWRASLARNRHPFLYDAIVDIRRAPAPDIDVVSAAFPRYDAAYLVEGRGLELDEIQPLQPSGRPMSAPQRHAIELCDGRRTMEEVTEILCRQAAEEDVSRGIVRSEVDEILQWLLEQGRLRMSG